MTCIFNKNLTLQIFNRCGPVEDRTLNLIIVNNGEALQIKIRDPSEYTFNYTETIDLANYEIMKAKQNLDINFTEFISNLLEMLQQLQKKEMFLKCETTEKICTLTFYNRSKIKSIIYLTIDLHATTQKEILNEVMNSMHYIKESNERLQLQVSDMKKVITVKDNEIKNLNFHRSELESQFYCILKQVEESIKMKSKDVECFLLRKIQIVSQRIGAILEEFKTLKNEMALKSDSSSKLLRNMENLRIENSKNGDLIHRLKQENFELQNAKKDMEKNLTDLRFMINEKDIENREFKGKCEELQLDLERATIAIAQKSATIDEISKDLVQANQMIVNYNNHYDSKVKELEKLSSILATKNKIIEEEKHKNYELRNEFDGYRIVFNSDSQEKLKHDLLIAQSKVDELEKSIRKVNKINALLSEKVNKLGI